MQKNMQQLKIWQDDFGKKYTDRNTLSVSALDKLYKRYFGTTRTNLNNEFIGKLSRDSRILEVGSNIGNQLLVLEKMGFKNLYGIEVNSYAVEIARSRSKNIFVLQGSAYDIPYKDGYFDLVFTAGVLIHIPLHRIKAALREIHRCTKRYIWGYEYFADTYTKGRIYRNRRNMFWKGNFAKFYLDLFKDLKLVKEKRLLYLNGSNVDTMFLLKK